MKKSLWILIAVLILVNGALLVLFPSEQDRPAPDELAEQIENQSQQFDRLSFWKRMIGHAEEPLYATQNSRYDGLEIDGDQSESVISVMIDNFSTARPQHEGIRKASIVYEALAEGGITRLMLLFPYQDIDRVGPIRSARDYFVDFASEYGGIYVHAGGSPSALEQLMSSDRLYHLDEDDRERGETYSWRDSRYSAPHNLFLDVNAVRDFSVEASWDLKPSRQEFCFREDPLSEDTAHDIDLNFSNDSSTSYYVQFQYMEDQQVYKRFYGKGKKSPHVDQGDGMQVAPVNIIVQIVPSQLIAGDDKERLTMQNVGQGAAYFFSGGMMKVGRWNKPNSAAATVFRDQTGGEVCLASGQTWIAVLDSEDLLEYQE